MNEIKQLDWDATVALNDWGNDAVDLFFNIATHKLYAIPLYLLLLIVIIRKHHWRQVLLILLSVAVIITVSDQLATLFKNVIVLRLRPFREPALDGIISKVGRSGGTYGFYSGHASSATALGVFIWLLLKNKARNMAIAMLVWALIVVYSRVYLGVHYLGDVLMGSFMGTLIAIGGFYFYQFLNITLSRKRNSHHHPAT